MIDVKLVVLFFCVYIVFGNPYCKICSHHTLCKYAMPGPSESCRSYDKAALLTRNDVKEILAKLNERRNYVAMGYSRFLPTAANMRKIIWSEELALFAQRWVDQCDQSLWPDKEDECRDLRNGAVGQSIATVLGFTSPFSVKSLVDTWFMRTLDYSGSVSYYNQSRDSKSKYFTQMIWAETGLVGCGRARFYIEHKHSIVERLVCNFAPQGNVHGKPVYAIGFPATQCPENMRPDAGFKGLCCRYKESRVNYSTYTTGRRTTTKSSKVSSLLRILNLSNYSAKHAIDPLRNNVKQVKPYTNLSAEQRNQKIRHIENNTYGFMGTGRRRVNPPTTFKFNRKPVTSVTPDEELRFHIEDRGHSRVHDHHVHRHEQTPNQSPLADAYRNECTRAEKAVPYNKETHNLRKSYLQNQCTRTPNECATTTCCDQAWCSQDFHELCTCNAPESHWTHMTTCSNPIPTHAKCTCNINYCQCLNLNYPTDSHLYNLRIHSTYLDEARISASVLEYYDQIPNIGISSGRRNIPNQKVTYKPLHVNKKIEKLKFIAGFRTEKPSTIYARKNNFHTYVKKDMDDKQINQHMQNTFKSFNSYRRNRRDVTTEAIYKPFWQMDEVTTKKYIELKSLRYTTLSNKRKRIKYRKQSIITEPITFRLSEDKNHINRKVMVTEKYLSFDELMRLRKLGDTDSIDAYEARRAKAPAKDTKTDGKAVSKADTKATAKTDKKVKDSKTVAKLDAKKEKKSDAKDDAKGDKKDKNKKDEVKTVQTTKATKKPTTKKEITTNTPFERKKFCTRKLTCTWTAVTVTNNEGSVIGGGLMDLGSLTPKGYVEGCTRTFTCTRVYMDRNKFSTAGDSSGDSDITGEGGTPQGEGADNGDEDYCEKRALDVHRRESGDAYVNVLSQLSSPTSNDYNEESTEKMLYEHSHESSNDCKCNDENLRIKRDEIINNVNPRKIKETLSYGELYYRVLQEIISGWRSHHPTDNYKCACNCGIRNTVNTYITFYILLFGNLTYVF